MQAAATIAEFMTPSPHTVGATTTLAVARAQMDRHEIRHLPVLEAGRLVGILTSRDLTLLENLPGVDEKEVRVEEAMTPDPFSVPPDATITEVARTMAERKYGAVVVVERGRVVGVFTTIDALRALAGT